LGGWSSTGRRCSICLIVGIIGDCIRIVQTLADSIDAGPSRAAYNRPMQASPDRIAVIFCTGISVIAFPGAYTAAGLWIASVGCAGIAVIAFLWLMHAFSILATINSACIVIIAIHGRMYAGGAIERIDSTGIAIIAIHCGTVADSFIAVIVCVWIAIIANLRLMLAFFAVEDVLGAGIIVIAIWRMMGCQRRLRCR
jgi:hypothetical protein